MVQVGIARTFIGRDRIRLHHLRSFQQSGPQLHSGGEGLFQHRKLPVTPESFHIFLNLFVLLQILEKLYAAFPKLQKVTTYAGPRSTLSKTPEEMSKGMIDKLQISLVMARRARLYLLDEPIGGVDVEAREHVLDLILENFNPKGTMLIVTHLIHDIEQLFDDVIVLKEGRVEMFTASDSLRAQYGGSLEEALKAMFREEAAR